jgi:hypothetical protein
MVDPLPQNLEMWVLETIRGGFKSIEVLEAERPPHAPPYDEDRALLQNFTTTVSRQGKVLARLSVVAETRAELTERMPGLANRVPAWLDAYLEGRPMTWEIFMQGIAQMMGRAPPGNRAGGRGAGGRSRGDRRSPGRCAHSRPQPTRKPEASSLPGFSKC